MSPRGGKRVGAGRPKGRKVPVPVFARVPGEVAAELQALADRQGVKLSVVVREALARLVASKPKRRKRRS